MKNKKGQFYIIAAIIIVLVLAGMASVRTYTITKSKPETISDIASTLNVEGSQVVDFGIYNGIEVNQLLDDFSGQFEDYFAGKTEQTDIVLIYGLDEQGNLRGSKITTQDTGGVSSGVGGAGITTSKTSGADLIEGTDYTIDRGTDTININMLGNNYNFNLRNNQMFYFVIGQKEGEETYIERN